MFKWVFVFAVAVFTWWLPAGAPIHAATAPTLTITKQVTTPTGNQPLADATYTVSRIEPTGSVAAMTATDANSYRLAGAAQTVRTDAQGHAAVANLVLNAHYLVTEADVETPAKPVIIKMTRNVDYTPKSGLASTAKPIQHVAAVDQPTARRQLPDTMAQTGGVMHNPLAVACSVILLVALIIVIGARAGRWFRPSVS